MSNHLIGLLSPRGVGLRLFLLLAGAIVAIAMVADAWRLRQERTRVLAQLQREASLVTQAIQGQVGLLLQEADDGRLGRLLEDVRQAKDAECVGAYSLEGRLVRAGRQRGDSEDSPTLFGGVLGWSLPKVKLVRTSLAPGDCVVMATDGVAANFGSSLRPGVPAQEQARRVLASHSRGSDDALVVAVRWMGGAA